MGGFAASPDTTSADVMAEGGVRIAPHLFAFGDVGRFRNLQPSDAQPAVDSTTAELSAPTRRVVTVPSAATGQN